MRKHLKQADKLVAGVFSYHVLGEQREQGDVNKVNIARYSSSPKTKFVNGVRGHCCVFNKSFDIDIRLLGRRPDV